MFRPANILIFAAVMLMCTYGYAEECNKGNETETICGQSRPSLVATCDEPQLQPFIHVYPRIPCRWNITSGCACNDGYIRESGLDSNCVLPEDCP